MTLFIALYYLEALYDKIYSLMERVRHLDNLGTIEGAVDSAVSGVNIGGRFILFELPLGADEKEATVHLRVMKCLELTGKRRDTQREYKKLFDPRHSGDRRCRESGCKRLGSCGIVAAAWNGETV